MKKYKHNLNRVKICSSEYPLSHIATVYYTYEIRIERGGIILGFYGVLWASRVFIRERGNYVKTKKEDSFWIVMTLLENM